MHLVQELERLEKIDVVWVKNKNDVIRSSENQKKLLIKALGFFEKKRF